MAITDWMSFSFLQLNSDKTVLETAFGPLASNIKSTSTSKNLGIILDPVLNFSKTTKRLIQAYCYSAEKYCQNWVCCGLFKTQRKLCNHSFISVCLDSVILFVASAKLLWLSCNQSKMLQRIQQTLNTGLISAGLSPLTPTVIHNQFLKFF